MQRAAAPVTPDTPIEVTLDVTGPHITEWGVKVRGRAPSSRRAPLGAPAVSEGPLSGSGAPGRCTLSRGKLRQILDPEPPPCVPPVSSPTRPRADCWTSGSINP
jgi:hypothetical protein